jgi:endoplasmic reticulum-Golgi intermediate compartment protein 3
VSLTRPYATLPDALRHSKADEATHLDPDYCGPCYGAQPPMNAQKPGCCNSCDEVREAYAGMSWAFGRGENVEQCEREHYGERLDAQRGEGCRIEGNLRVNKVVGNFHIAPGRSFSNGNMHVHDLNNYFESPMQHTFTHTIHQLRFGPQLPDSLQTSVDSPWTNHHLNPLDSTSQFTDETPYNFMYFIKVVSTAYLPIGSGRSRGRRSEAAPLGTHGVNADGSLETHQYSVTSHKRSLGGGTDATEGHKERMHARGGIPGVFFSYVS